MDREFDRLRIVNEFDPQADPGAAKCADANDVAQRALPPRRPRAGRSPLEGAEGKGGKGG